MAPAFDVQQFAGRFSIAAARAGFQAETIGMGGDSPLVAYTKTAAGKVPRIYLSAGIHGDEPVPPRALVGLVERGFFDDRATWLLCPMLNPSGLAHGTRENAAGIDLNRDYRDPVSPEIRAHVAWLRRQGSFDLAISLHEDWEATGFYLFEFNPTRRPSLAAIMIDAVRPVCPIDHSPAIDGFDARAGIIRPERIPDEMPLWPETVYLGTHNTRLAYTIETPSALPPPQREAAINAALAAALPIAP